MGTFNYMAEPLPPQESMAEVKVVPKRIGGSVAVFLPADFVRREGIHEGQAIWITVKRKGRPPVLGILKGVVPYEPFDRHAEGFEPDE